MKNIVVYGDIHGCLDELKQLRKKVKLQPNDIEVSVGDFLNKGPFSLQTLRYMTKHNIQSVMGNNEVKIIKLYKRYSEEGSAFLATLAEYEREIIENITKEELKQLKSLPYFLKFANLTIVHGGIMNETNLDTNLDKETKKQLTLLRFFNKDLNPIPWHDFEGRYKFWTELYDGHEGFAVFGHHPFDAPKIDEFSVGIDTGCVYGGKLTAAKFTMGKNEVDTKNYQLISVDAQENYWARYEKSDTQG